MFTGIVEEVGMVEAMRMGHEEGSMSIRGNVAVEGVGLGDSLAVNGVCLTITSLKDKVFSFDFNNIFTLLAEEDMILARIYREARSPYAHKSILLNLINVKT